MDNNLLQICQDSIPKFLGLFDLSIAPKLLFYAYVPAIVISLYFAVIIMVRDKFSKVSLSFFAMALTFSIWLGNEIVQWTAVYHWMIFTSWKLSIFFETLFFLSILFTLSSFIQNSKILKRVKYVNFVMPIAALFVINSTWNMMSYDFQNCEGVPGQLWLYFYMYQFLMLIFVWWAGSRALKEEQQVDHNKYKMKVLAGIITLFALFLATNIASEVVGSYFLNILIPVGMIACVALIAFPAVEHPIFSFKFYRSEVLIYSSIALVGSLLLIPDFTSQRIVIIGTLLALIFVGKSVMSINKREAKQRDELDNLNKKLQKLDATKNEFLSFATHQLRSPLTSIKWGLNSLKEKYSPETTDHLLATTDDLIGTVNDLLDISKIEQGGLVMKMEEFDLHDFVGRVVEEFRMTAEKKGLRLAFTGDIVPCFVLADENKLRQVFVNLIDNAIKYTQKGDIKVVFRRIGKTAEVSVWDTGPGIAPEELKDLFDKFLRGAAGKASQGGSGLGLYLAKKIIENHKGHLSAKSDGIGKGSVFTVALPLKS